ncbi:hypothetical protein ABZ814_05470 [Micromonospora musae]|uniref:hypothetical protein n=1 Tax=Micromonospora musae TaxID=1894970 RepID=UPI0033E641FE
MPEPVDGPGTPLLGKHRAVNGGYRRVVGAHRAPGASGPSRGYLFTVALLAGTASMPILAAISTGSATVGSTALPDSSTPFIPTPSVGPVVVPLPTSSQPSARPTSSPSAVSGWSAGFPLGGPDRSEPPRYGSDDTGTGGEPTRRPLPPPPAPRPTPSSPPGPSRPPSPTASPSPSTSPSDDPTDDPTTSPSPSGTISVPPTEPTSLPTEEPDDSTPPDDLPDPDDSPTTTVAPRPSVGTRPTPPLGTRDVSHLTPLVAGPVIPSSREPANDCRRRTASLR